jgi:hypothetical protein
MVGGSEHGRDGHPCPGAGSQRVWRMVGRSGAVPEGKWAWSDRFKTA